MANNAFEKIMETEKNSGTLIAEAKEKAASVKKAAIDKINALESEYRASLGDCQKSLALNENVAIAVNSTEAEAKWYEEKNSMDEIFKRDKDMLISELLRKVVD